jgi:hypothetical protein
MPPVGFEPMISALEPAKTVHALDRAQGQLYHVHYALCDFPSCIVLTLQIRCMATRSRLMTITFARIRSRGQTVELRSVETFQSLLPVTP